MVRTNANLTCFHIDPDISVLQQTEKIVRTKDDEQKISKFLFTPPKVKFQKAKTKTKTKIKNKDSTNPCSERQTFTPLRLKSAPNKPSNHKKFHKSLLQKKHLPCLSPFVPLVPLVSTQIEEDHFSLFNVDEESSYLVQTEQNNGDVFVSFQNSKWNPKAKTQIQNYTSIETKNKKRGQRKEKTKTATLPTFSISSVFRRAPKGQNRKAKTIFVNPILLETNSNAGQTKVKLSNFSQMCVDAKNYHQLLTNIPKINSFIPESVSGCKKPKKGALLNVLNEKSEGKTTWVFFFYTSSYTSFSLSEPALDKLTKLNFAPHFSSSSSSSSSFEEFLTQKLPKSQHHYIAICEKNETPPSLKKLKNGEKKRTCFEFQQVMKIRIGDLHGELVWLQKGEQTNGKCLIDLYTTLKPLFQSVPMYIFDDSRIFQSDVYIFLRMRVLSTPARGNWYQKNFEASHIVSANRIHTLCRKRLLSQNFQTFTKSRNQIRNLPLFIFMLGLKKYEPKHEIKVFTSIAMLLEGQLFPEIKMGHLHYLVFEALENNYENKQLTQKKENKTEKLQKRNAALNLISWIFQYPSALSFCQKNWKSLSKQGDLVDHSWIQYWKDLEIIYFTSLFCRPPDS